jgi:hypothetical protein
VSAVRPSVILPIRFAAGAQAAAPQPDSAVAEAPRALSGALVPSAPSTRPGVAAEVGAADGASPVWLAAGGVAGTMVGLAGGLVVGGVLAGPSEPGCESFCSNGEIVGAGLAGEALGAALGVHLANGRRARRRWACWPRRGSWRRGWRGCRRTGASPT